MDDDRERLRSLASAEAPKRLDAARSLAQSPDASAAVALLTALADTNDEVRQWANEALENLGEPSLEHLTALLESTVSDNNDQAYWAITLIGRLGPRAIQARAELARLAEMHQMPEIRRRAVWALQRIGTPK